MGVDAGMGVDTGTWDVAVASPSLGEGGGGVGVRIGVAEGVCSELVEGEDDAGKAGVGVGVGVGDGVRALHPAMTIATSITAMKVL